MMANKSGVRMVLDDRGFIKKLHQMAMLTQKQMRFANGEAVRWDKKWTAQHLQLKGSGKWTSLKEATKKAKRRKYGGRKPILVANGRMRDSIIRAKHPDGFVKITNTYAAYGTNVPYAVYHQYGTKNMPQREIFFYSKQREENLMRAYEMWMEKWLKKTRLK